MVALDTNILIYVLEGHAEFGPAAAAVLRTAQGDGTLSELVYLELLSKADFSNARHRQLALDFLADQQLRFTPVSKAILLRAAELRAGRASLDAKLGVGDAVHLASALQTGAETFITNDQILTRLSIPGLRVVSL